ncbi:MAG: DUF4240 domain-containing protein [Bacteroidota bacterium]
MSELDPYNIGSEFWRIVDIAKNEKKLNDLVKDMSDNDLVNFYWSYRFIAAEPKYERCIEALNSVEEMTDDYLDEICDWVVAQGKDYYNRFLAEPESMLDTINFDCPDSVILSKISKEYNDRHDAVMPYIEQFPE